MNKVVINIIKLIDEFFLLEVLGMLFILRVFLLFWGFGILFFFF